jgi:hypothetical protein
MSIVLNYRPSAYDFRLELRRARTKRGVKRIVAIVADELGQLREFMREQGVQPAPGLWLCDLSELRTKKAALALGLALVCELLAGAIVGSASVATMTPPERGIINGMLSIVIDPSRLNNHDSMMVEIDGMIAWVRSAAPADPDLPVLIAGDPERIARAERMANGIEVDETTWGQLVEIAARYQIAVPQ